MADASILAQTYNNSGTAVAYNTTNYEQIVNTQGLSGNLIIASIVDDSGDLTEAQLVSVLKLICNGKDIGATQDAFNVVGVSGFDGTDPVYVALNGTGTLGTTSGDYGSGVTVTVVATFSLAV